MHRVPCLFGCLAVFFPRLALVLLWLFGGGYVMRAFDHVLFPLLGFFFLPLTTIAYVFSMNSLAPAGDVPPLGWILIALAGLSDLGLLGGGAYDARRGRD